VDGELDTAAAQEVTAAIAVDTEVRRKIELLRLSGSIVHDAFCNPKYESVSPFLAQKLGLGISKKRRSLFSWRKSLFSAATIVAAVIGYGAGIWHAGSVDFADELMDEVAEYHAVYAREGDHQVEIKANRLEEIQSWLGGRLQRELRVPDLTARGLVFRGARLLVVDKRPVAELLYSSPLSSDRPFALCITTGPGEEIVLKMAEHEGINLALWSRKGFVYVLAGWLDKSELKEIATELGPKLDKV
jgi:anti-sigma factor RsiW